MSTVRTAYLCAATTAVELLAEARVAGAWNAPSTLDGMTVGALAGHLARSVLQVEWFLDGAVDGTANVSAVAYYARITDAPDPDSGLNRGVRARSEATALAGPNSVATEAAEALARLHERLLDEPATRSVPILHRPGEVMRLDSYLATRCVELSVHTEDLALSIDSALRTPPAAVGVAVDLLVAAARERHGDAAVLHALSRRERDETDALRVL
ncbi:maleylpyruvate isomerase N-terminal domain-containing protein [Solicola gregarius]|uniref:Maleylpyruvate isomerase N-terminal domain-containing protein n=1 Tax=Solicola gregarius TaxID=2908642 RepID=A0AA46TGJ3_9ACTN|nr:maleylpyruvate isomerase N-terminal domain-containing protein [Solicola gregarius]UYM04429.1 maleylpyruvate isomerase N-terminal domain-containing protein [Solicola gregarius]